MNANSSPSAKNLSSWSIAAASFLASLLISSKETIAAERIEGRADGAAFERSTLTSGFKSDAYALLANAASPYGYGKVSIRRPINFAILSALTSHDDPRISQMASALTALRENYVRGAQLQRQFARAQGEAVNQLRLGLLMNLFSAVTSDGNVSFSDVAETTSNTLRPLQESVLDILDNDVAANDVCTRLVRQARALASDLHGSAAVRTNVIQARFDNSVAHYGFIDFVNVSGRPLKNCIVIANASMNADYVERTMRTPGELSIFLGFMGMSLDTVANAREVESLMIKIRSSDQGMFVFVPNLETNVPVRFKVCDPAGMHFSKDLVIQLWSEDLGSEEISLKLGLVSLRARLAQEKALQQQQMRRRYSPQFQPNPRRY